MRETIVLIVLGLLTLTVAPAYANTNGGCEPEPIGYCPVENRVQVVFCYVTHADGGLVSATEENVVEIGGANRLDADARPLLYLRNEPIETFVLAPLASPVPKSLVWEETNNVDGLQPKAFRCGVWTWFGEFGSWMGPFNLVDKLPDEVVV